MEVEVEMQVDVCRVRRARRVGMVICILLGRLGNGIGLEMDDGGCGCKGKFGSDPGNRAVRVINYSG